MENNNKNADLKYDDSYDETVGFFSDSFYRKKEFKNESENANAIKDESHIEDTNEKNSEESSESPVSQLEGQENDMAESVTENEDSENTAELKPDNEGTYNAFITQKNAAQKVVENSVTESVKKEQPIIEVLSSIKGNDEKAVKHNSSEQIVVGIDYSFFAAERIRIAKENVNKKRMYIILSIICAALFFIVIPLFLLPVFILQCIKYSKKATFSTFLNYDTLKWKEIKGATSYEIYVKVDSSDKFTLFSTESQPKCSLPRGMGNYLIIAKKDSTIIAVSDVISVSI